jgi:hypothetical protein
MGLQLANARRSTAGLGPEGDKLHGRVVGRRSVVEMAPSVAVIRWLTDDRGAQSRGASARVGVLVEGPRQGTHTDRERPARNAKALQERGPGLLIAGEIGTLPRA